MLSIPSAQGFSASLSCVYCRRSTVGQRKLCKRCSS